MAKVAAGVNSLVARLTGPAPDVWPTLLRVIDELTDPWADPTAADWGVFLTLVAKASRVVAFDAGFLAGVAELRRLVIAVDPDQESDVVNVPEREPRAVSSDTAADEWLVDVLAQRGWGNAA
jgi:hypothetical protein